MKNIIIIAVVLAIALGGWYVRYFSDKAVIKRKLTGVALNLNKEEAETAMQIALKMRNVQNILAPGCLVIVPEQKYEESLERDMIIRYLIYHRNLYNLITVSFEDMLIDIPTAGKAMVQTTVRILKIADQPDPVETLAQVEISMEKVDKEWLLQLIIVPEILLE